MSERRVLHAALMPYPSPQGTQGALRAMLLALLRRGDDATLFSHPHGDGARVDVPLLRSPSAPFGRSLRSGPSLGRAALDALALPSLARAAEGRALLAHNVEAGFAAALVGAPYVFVAHTQMSLELPYYTARGARALTLAGHALDHLAASRARVVAAISPHLVDALGEALEREVAYLPIPWPSAIPTPREARMRVRARLGLDEGTLVVGVAGNLDRYQGTQRLLPTLAQLLEHTEAALVVATESEPSPLMDEARRAGLAERLHVLPLRGEAERVDVHACCDIMLVPRTCEGGVPIKLLDALARGVPVVASHEACAGLPFGAAVLATRAEPQSLAAACALAHDPRSREALAARGHAYLEAHHPERAFLRAHDALVDALHAASASRVRRGRA